MIIYTPQPEPLTRNGKYATRRILVTKKRPSRQEEPERFYIEVPRNCKITLSYFNPGSHRYDQTRALRIYEGRTQIACFVDVQEFRDVNTVSMQTPMYRVMTT